MVKLSSQIQQKSAALPLTRFSISLAFSCCASFNIFSISSILWASNPEALQHTEGRRDLGWKTVNTHAWKPNTDSGKNRGRQCFLHKEKTRSLNSLKLHKTLNNLRGLAWQQLVYHSHWSTRVPQHVVAGTKRNDPSRGRRGRLECSHGNRANCWLPSLSPFWGTGGVASGDAGLHAVGALQAQGVVRLVATRRRLMMQDGAMDGGRQICGCRDSCHRLTAPSADGVNSLLLVDCNHIQSMLPYGNW